MSKSVTDVFRGLGIAYIVIGNLFGIPVAISYTYASMFALFHGSFVGFLIGGIGAFAFGFLRAVTRLPSLMWTIHQGFPGGFWLWFVPGFFTHGG